MRTEDSQMVVKLQALQVQRGDLEKTLHEVKAAIAETEMRLTQTNEERSEFEDANSNVMYALEQAAADARAAHAAHAAEAEVVRTVAGAVEAAKAARGGAAGATSAATSAAAAAAAGDASAAAAAHAWFRSEEAAMLLGRLQFCAREMATMAEKEAQMVSENSHVALSFPEPHNTTVTALPTP